MARIGIVTDSTASLPPEFVAKHNIKIVPLVINFGSDSYRDGVDMTGNEFLKRLTSFNHLPTTSQPAIGDFVEAFEELAKDCDEIICIVLTSKLSGTYSSALTAAEMTEGSKVTVIDSLSTYMGLGLMVQRAAEAAEAGQSVAQITEMVRALVPKMHIILAVETLEYLKRGGRIGGGAAFIGGLLNIKPILQVKDGVVEALERVRSKKKANQRLVELTAEDVSSHPAHIVLGGVDNDDELADVEAMLKQSIPNIVEFQRVSIGPVLSTHTGPGVVGIVYYHE